MRLTNLILEKQILKFKSEIIVFFFDDFFLFEFPGSHPH